MLTAEHTAPHRQRPSKQIADTECAGVCTRERASERASDRVKEWESEAQINLYIIFSDSLSNVEAIHHTDMPHTNTTGENPLIALLLYLPTLNRLTPRTENIDRNEKKKQQKTKQNQCANKPLLCKMWNHLTFYNFVSLALCYCLCRHCKCKYACDSEHFIRKSMLQVFIQSDLFVFFCVVLSPNQLRK